MSVEYITMPGWKSSIAGCKVYEDLPANAKKYIETIEQYLNIPGIYEYVVSKDKQTPTVISKLSSYGTPLFGKIKINVPKKFENVKLHLFIVATIKTLHDVQKVECHIFVS